MPEKSDYVPAIKAHKNGCLFCNKAICCCELHANAKFPPEERFNLIQQVRRAALSVMLNLAEGSSRKTPRERRRYYQISMGSVVEIDAALDVASDLGYLRVEELKEYGNLLLRVFQMLIKMINKKDP